MTHRLYAVDRIQGASAVLLDDAGRVVTVPRSRLPRDLAEGDVLRVPEQGGTPDWGTAVVDAQETARRRDEARSRLEDLKQRDPGGDVRL